MSSAIGVKAATFRLPGLPTSLADGTIGVRAGVIGVRAVTFRSLSPQGFRHRGTKCYSSDPNAESDLERQV
jgi:hypothetical protein